MRTLNLVALLILIIGGFQLGLRGFVNFDALVVLLGVDGARIVEGVGGIAALYGILLIGVVSRRSDAPFEDLRLRESEVSFADADRKGARITIVR